MMLASVLPAAAVRQVRGDLPEALSEILEDGVNLAVWQRQLSAPVDQFNTLLLARNQSLAESLVLEMRDNDAEPDLCTLASGYTDLPGYDEFITDVSWLVSAFACLMGAKRIGLRLRILDKAMCPRFHIDHVPVRLITTYAGGGSQWLEEGVMNRAQLGRADAEPTLRESIQQLACAAVALLKGEKWTGNEGFGLIHRSPQPTDDQRRLLMTLDWLA
jgi:hypothetical protein